MYDQEVFEQIENELKRQQSVVELIASENIVSREVLMASGSVLTNKYAEGYPEKRYYGGCEYVDVVESLAIERAKKLFSCNFANVQPHSGASANHAVMFALLNPGDTVLGMDIACGGHLTHGANKTSSGTWFNAVGYKVKQDTELLDYDEIEDLAKKHKPKLIIAGASAYSRVIDWKKFREIADKVGALLMTDIAHYAGLICKGKYPSPVEFADVVTTTTHKTLRGPRGGMILTNNEDIAKKVNSAVFPGTQGGPLMHIIAAKAVSFKEALSDDFGKYIDRVMVNAKFFANSLQNKGFRIISGGTDCHMFMTDLTNFGVTGKVAEKILDLVNITCNKNMIPFDKLSPFVASGLRFGTAATTTRGFGCDEFEIIAEKITEVVKFAQNNQEFDKNDPFLTKTKEDMTNLCGKFPIYS